jgi:multiple sugar transport system ATP-binding protein
MHGIAGSGIAKSFGPTRVLSDVSLTIGKGEFVSLVGPSGCGKTTLMRIIAGLERPDHGRIEIDGRDVTGLRAADRDVAMVFQNYALYPHLTVYQNMAVPLVMRRLSALERMPLLGRVVPGTRARRSAIDQEVRETAGLLGLDPLLQRKPAQLSGGQRQRVALGRAIVRHPRAFLMDEPLSNLDAALRVHTRKEIVDIHRKVGAATVYVTHDQSEAMTMSDRVAVMMGGDILQIAAPQEIYADPSDLRVATFIGSPRINMMPVTVGDDGRVRIDTVPLALSSPHRGPATLAVRPEHLAIAGEGLEITIEHTEFLGDSLLVHGRPRKGGETIIVRLPATGGAQPQRGTKVRLAFDPDRALLFGGDGRRVALSPAESLSPPLPEAVHG